MKIIIILIQLRGCNGSISEYDKHVNFNYHNNAYNILLYTLTDCMGSVSDWDKKNDNNNIYTSLKTAWAASAIKIIIIVIQLRGCMGSIGDRDMTYILINYFYKLRVKFYFKLSKFIGSISDRDNNHVRWLTRVKRQYQDS